MRHVVDYPEVKKGCLLYHLIKHLHLLYPVELTTARIRAKYANGQLPGYASAFNRTNFIGVDIEDLCRLSSIRNLVKYSAHDFSASAMYRGDVEDAARIFTSSMATDSSREFIHLPIVVSPIGLVELSVTYPQQQRAMLSLRFPPSTITFPAVAS